MPEASSSQVLPPARRGRLQFRLRTLLVFVVILAVPLVLTLRWHHRAVRQRDAVAELQKNFGNTVEYEEGLDPETDPLPVPDWLQGALSFDHFYNVIDVVISDPSDDQLRLLDAFPKLESLGITGVTPQFTFDGMRQLRSLPHLRSLDLWNAPVADDETLAAIGSLAQLESLQVDCGPGVTDAGLAELARLSELNFLALRCGLQTTDRGLGVFESLAKLEGLTLDLNDSCSELAAALDQLAGLRPLAPVYRMANRNPAAALAGANRLKSLKMIGDGALSNDTLTELAQLRELNSLAVHSRGGLTDAALARIRRITSLRSLFLNSTNPAETDDGLASLAGLVNMTKLELSLGPEVSDAGLARLRDCPRLSRLRLYCNDRATGEGLARLTALEYLELNYKTRSDQAPVGHLQVPSGVADLVLHGHSGLTDEDLARLADHKNLQRLELFRCEQVTDAGIVQLARLDQLRELRVYWCPHTTRAAVEAVRRALPNCSADHFEGGGSIGFFNRF